MKMKVNNNVPQWIIDVFNIVEFRKISKSNKKVALTFLTMWANTNLYLVNSKKYYPATEKRINKYFDKDLLNLMNKYDYDFITQDDKNKLQSNIDKWVKMFNIPINKNYEIVRV